MENLPVGSVEATQLLKESMTRRALGQSSVRTSITLPAAPGMVDEYLTLCANLTADLGRRFSDDDRAQTRKMLKRELAVAYSASPRSTITIVLIAPGGRPLQYAVSANKSTLQREYAYWMSSRKPPLFGTEPDARVWALANEAADPARHRILDIGAGTGRNALPLARRGHPVDAVELTPKYAEILRFDAEQESLDVRVIVRDVFASIDDLRRDYQLILLSGVVSDFWTTQQLRGLFELAAQCLAPGGRLLFNAFLTCRGFTPDKTARELGQYFYSSFFTRDEMAAAASELPLELVADDSAHDYEKVHLPEGAWPPTGWYADWASGLNPFGVDREMSPIELRWLVYQKTG